MNIAIIAITRGGKQVAEKLQAKLANSTILSGKGVAAKIARNWGSFGGFICVMATGIVVRSIAPLLTDKRIDPCVVVVDEGGKHAISLLSGHLGGGNDLAVQVAEIVGGTAVITTASDTLGLVALDLWAHKQQLTAEKEVFTRASSILVNKGSLRIFTDLMVDSLPVGLEQVTEPEEADLIISSRSCYTGHLVLCPKNLVVGTGCNRHTPASEFVEAVTELFTDLGYQQSAIRNLASIDKKNDEVGLLEFAHDRNLEINFFNKDEINRITDVEVSKAAMKAVGAIGVAEPCALLSGSDISVDLCPAESPGGGVAVVQKTKLISRKRKWQNITMAVAQVPFTLSAQV